MKDGSITKLSQDVFLSAPVIDTSIELCVFNVRDVDAVKTKLLKFYGNAECVCNGTTQRIDDIVSADEVTVFAQSDFNKNRYNAADAVRVVTRLTRPQDGCPWDRAQTHESIRANIIEEAYEAVDAIDNADLDNMCEEFGDVLLQSLLQSDIARRNGEFDFDDVCDGLCKKLIGRHTFIFGADKAANADDALEFWNKAKTAEKHGESIKQALSRMPDGLPALMQCQKAYKKQRKAGLAEFDKAELIAAAERGDYLAVLEQAARALADDKVDAETELNKRVRRQIAELPDNV